MAPETRKDRARKAGYRVLLHFARHHTKSTLAGMTTYDNMPFCDEVRALEWLAAVNRPKIARRNGYFVGSHRIETL